MDYNVMGINEVCDTSSDIHGGVCVCVFRCTCMQQYSTYLSNNSGRVAVHVLVGTVQRAPLCLV